ncbi:hypothetical protein AM629_19575 [Photorhabdus heterorhabditis]|uniref:Uncharacterized protein n=1 Tax=Photorhabdus heterorhabditis TaxID=880156 RepID=A0ABR5K7E8_9GAMM|nr:hypothetical protein AM629_19575 [Photorhabdus heterorhabditis]
MKYEVFIAISRRGQTERVLDKAYIAHNIGIIGMMVIAFARASVNSLADVCFALYDKTIHLTIIPVIFQVASLLAALTHPGHRVLYDIVIYAPGDSLPCRRDAS